MYEYLQHNFSEQLLDVLIDIWMLLSLHTSISVPKKVSIDIVDVGVDGGTARDTARSHVWVIFRVDVLKALPWYTWAEL